MEQKKTGLKKHPNKKIPRKSLSHYSIYCLNNEPFGKQTVLNHFNTELVCHSGPTIFYLILNQSNKSTKKNCNIFRHIKVDRIYPN